MWSRQPPGSRGRVCRSDPRRGRRVVLGQAPAIVFIGLAVVVAGFAYFCCRRVAAPSVLRRPAAANLGGRFFYRRVRIDGNGLGFCLAARVLLPVRSLWFLCSNWFAG